MDSKPQSKPSILYETNTDGKVLYVRHGQTEFNHQCPIIGEDKIQAYPQFIDCPLNGEGLSSLQSAITTIASLTLHSVYCSPLHRTLQTAYHIFVNHPQRESIVITVHPLLTEKVNGVHDYSFDIAAKKKEFNMESKVKFNWDLFDSYNKTAIEQEMYMVKFIPKDNEEINALVKKIEEVYMGNEASDDKKKEVMRDLYGKMGEVLVRNKMKTLETYSHTFIRSVMFKRYLLKKLIEENGNEDDIGKDNEKKVIVVTHSAYIRMSTTLKAYDSINDIPMYPDDSYHCQNGEIISMKIDKDVCIEDTQLEL